MTNSENNSSTEEGSNLLIVGGALVLGGIATALETKFGTLNLPANYKTAAAFLITGTGVISVDMFKRIFDKRQKHKG